MVDLAMTIDSGVRRISIRRPPLNVLTMAAMDSLASALGEIGERDRLVVLEGGRHFCAGADVGEHLPPKGAAMLDAFDRLFETLVAVPVPTLAVVRGACLGGGFELALGCDLVLAAHEARFAVPEVRLGVFPPVAAAILPERIGAARAKDLLFSGREIDGRTAADWGLISRAVADSALDAAAEVWIRELGALSPEALRACKAAVRGRSLARAGEVYRTRTLDSADGREGLTAFLEKRRPVWG